MFKDDNTVMSFGPNLSSLKMNLDFLVGTESQMQGQR